MISGGNHAILRTRANEVRIHDGYDDDGDDGDDGDDDDDGDDGDDGDIVSNHHP